jgi:small-conductance mechanosensitive channel
VSVLLCPLLPLGCAPAADAPAAGTPKTGVAPAAAEPTPAPASTLPTSLGELPEAVFQLETFRAEVESATAVDAAETAAMAELERALRRVDRADTRLDGLPYDELLEASRRLASSADSVRRAGDTVRERLRRVDDGSRKAAELRAVFDELARLAADPDAPPALRLRAGLCRAQLEELETALTKRRAAVLVLVDELAEARGKAAALAARTEKRLSEARRALAVSAEEPAWSLSATQPGAWAEVGGRLARDARRVRRWLESSFATVAVLSLVFFGGTLLLLRRLRPAAERRAAEDPAATAGLRFMENPVVAAIPVTLLALVAFAPEAPAFAYELAWLPGAPATAWILGRVLGPRVRRTVWVLAATLAATPFAEALDPVPLADRLANLLMTAPLAIVLGVDLYRGRIAGDAAGQGWRAGVMKTLGWLLAGCLGVASACHVLGRVGLGTFLANGALGTLGGIFLVVAAHVVASGLVRGLLATRPLRALHMVRDHADVVADRLLGAFRLFSVLLVVAVSLHAFHMGDALGAALEKVLGARAQIGSVTLSPASLAGFVLVLWLSSRVARVLGFLLAEEILPRLDLRRGTAVAISGTTRYVVLLGGFVMAAGVAGIDLTKFGFLAGALGVGIGFGLQNIVSNFISGLILLFERPIEVGDVVDVTGAAGTVTQIGIRASKVLTFDGSEVIVPNADLISKSVVNWTGASPNRRFDVTVGVGYGSSMETVARSLLAAAGRTPGILAEPAAEAFFESFGASSLDWTLRVWVRMDESGRVLSALRRAVAEELAGAGIEVPFPQQDVHIRTTPTAGTEPATGPGSGR